MSDWYYAADNEQKGPINESELKANFATNKLPTDTLVWKEGMDNWTPANQVPAFSFRQPPAPAKTQPATLTPTPGAVAAASPAINNPDSTKPVAMADILGTPEALEVDPDDADKNKIFGILAYLGILFLVPLLAAKDSPFAKYHANQGLTLFIGEIIIYVVITIVSLIVSAILPSGLGILATIVSLAGLLVILIGVILGIVNAAAGKCVPLPVIGGVKLLK